MRRASRLTRAIPLAVCAGLLWSAIAMAGPYTRLQVLLPGETAAPGTATGKTGTPAAQTADVPFSITVRACDDTWTPVATVTNAIQILSSDASATLPAPAQLSGGAATFPVTFRAGGSFTVFAHDQTDGTIPDGASSSVASLVLQGFAFSTINQKNQYAGVPMTVTLRAVSPTGATVTGYAGQVHLKEITSYGDGRISPEFVTLSGGQWTGAVTCYRADETSINRGNVNLYAFLDAAPQKNGTSDPFTVHPGPFTRVQVVVPGQTPLPGSVAGVAGSPATQSAARSFPVSAWGTDAYWNPVPVADNVRITSSDPGFAPVSGVLVNGYRQLTVSLPTVGTQTLTIADLTNGSITGMTSAGIAVIPSSVDHFEISTINSPLAAGSPVSVTIRATDASGNTIPTYAGDAILQANTGSGSILPEFVTFSGGQWTGMMVFKGSGGAVSFTVSDFAAPPHSGTSNSFTVNPGPLAGVQVLVPGESSRGGTTDGREGTPTTQQAGTPFNITVRGVDAFWNMVPGVNDSVSLSSTDAFAGMPPRVRLNNGQVLVPVTLYRVGGQQILADNASTGGQRRDTSSVIPVTGGPFARLLVLAPGEIVAPGMPNGRAGTATDQSINYAFNVTVLATDNWYNPVTGVSDVVRLASDDPLATLPPDTPLVNGRAELTMRLARGGYNQISVSDVTQPSVPGSATQVRAISSGFHLEALISPASARAGEPFTITVKVTNDAGSVIQEINSFVTLEVQNASTRQAGRGTLLTTQFQLLQGQRAVSETYTFAEPILIVARDDAGNAPATSNAIVIQPGLPSAIRTSSSPPWVGGNKHATVSGRLVDAFENGIPDVPMTFSVLVGAGTLTPIDNVTAADGTALVDFLSPRTPEMGRLRAAAGGLIQDFDLQTAFVDPGAAGGHITNYPNPFHPPTQATTIAYKLSDHASVTMRIFTLSGDLVLERLYDRGALGGTAGLNEVTWDGRNGVGDVVASGGYVVLVEAQGTGETLHVIRRKLAVVR